MEEHDTNLTGKAGQSQTNATATPPGAEFSDLLDAENAALAERRRIAGVDSELPRVGLALSGGGIRSATFCLGLVRGLAGNALLKRIDYLSTVSGGGFTGGMLGRLISSIGIVRAQSALSRTDSLVMWWLRRNGRYLTPAGSRDLGMALVTYLRAWIAVHIEFAFVALLAGVMIATPHLLQNEWGWFDPQTWGAWGSAWWPLAIMTWLIAAPGTMLAYWIARDAPDAPAATRRPRAGPGWRDGIVFVLLAALVGALLLGHIVLPAASGMPLKEIGALILLGMLVRYASTLLRLHRTSARTPLGVARERNRLTRVLRRWTLIALALVAIGVLDFLSWTIYTVLARTAGTDFSNWMFGGLGVTGVIIAILRALAEPLQKLESAANAARTDWRSRLLNALGFALGLFLLLAWMTLVQWFVFDGPPWSPVDTWSEPLRALLIVAGTVLWFVFTAPHADTANASSLHSFYRARLTRAWLSVGNPERFASGRQRQASSDGFTAVPPDERTGETALNDVHSVTEVIAGDDITLGHHRPEANGGPIHLINTCLNQTRDDNSDLYNADRKGCMMTIGARGMEWGRNCFHPLRDGDDVGTLGRWIAISGAAAAPGAGSYTSSGWAMTLFFLGVRLGYWLRKPAIATAQRGAGQPRGFDAWRWRHLPKPRLLLSEARARYGGLQQPWWYLSDGGHFENTAVYPLLRRRLDFIVLADCGADARFELGDLDNLVRKARIDFGAEIEFYTHDDAVKRFDLAGSDLTVLSPEDLAANTSARGVLLARIRYRDDGAGAKTGTLLVVKPNLHKALDADVLGYALRNPGFPQQATGDQFFDEAQWESYQRLGFDFGHELDDAWLARLPGWAKAAADDATELERLRKPAPRASEADSVPFWRRTMPAAALGTTLGIGASTTLLLAAWQVVDQLRKERESVRDGHVTAIINAELYLDAQRSALTAAEAPRVPLALRTHASELLAIADSQMDRQTQFRYETVLGAFATHCAEVDKAGSSPSPAGSLCGVPRWIVSNVRPEYWQPTCRSRFSRPLDLRSCPEQAVERVVIDNVAQQATPMAAPVPLIASEPTALPAMAPVGAMPAIAACLQRGVTLYTQVYDEDTRQAVVGRFQALPMKSEERTRIPAVENVVRSAERRGVAAPARWRKPTLLVHDPADRECAEAFVAEAGGRLLKPGIEISIRPLPSSLKATPRVIELWLPSGSVATPDS